MLVPWPPEQLAARRGHFAQAAAENGLEVGERTHWYDSTPAHEAVEWAVEHGGADELRRAVFRAYFVHDRNIASPKVLADLAEGAGLDGEALRAALQEGRYRERIAAQYEEARSVGVTAVPTFIAQPYALVGAHPYENFRKLMDSVSAAPTRTED